MYDIVAIELRFISVCWRVKMGFEYWGKVWSVWVRASFLA